MPQLIAAIYARKSTDQAGVADEARSVRRQVEHAHLYATEKGWCVDPASVFVDDGISGAEFANRPGFVRMMAALKPRPPFQALIMSEESRLGREAIETAYALKQIVTAGVRVFFYLEDRERTLESPTDKILLSLTAFADELEREKARQRVTDTMTRKARAGHVTGGRVFGYDNMRDAAGVHRVINQDEARVVVRVFELAAGGYGFTTIAKLLNEAGERSPRAQQGRPNGWAPSSVREVLFRPLYRGEIVWNQTRKRDTWGIKHQQPRPEHDWIRVPAPHLTIVPEDLWASAHRQMATQRARYALTSPSGAPPWTIGAKYLLTGFLTCGACGSGLEARSRSHGKGRKVFYGCAGYFRRGRTVCTNTVIAPMEAADSAVLASVEQYLLHPAVLETAVFRAVDRLAVPAHTDSAAARAELAKVEGELRRLTAAVAEGDGSLPTLVSAIRVREDRRSELVRLTKSPRSAMSFSPKGILEDLQDRLSDARALLRQETPRARALLQQLVVGRLTMMPNQEEQSYTFKGTGSLVPMLAGVVPQSVASPHGIAALWYVDLAGRIDRYKDAA